MNLMECEPSYVKVDYRLGGASIVLGGYIPRKLTSESGGLLCQPESRVTAVYIVLLSDVLIQELPNSASSSRVRPQQVHATLFVCLGVAGLRGKPCG